MHERFRVFIMDFPSIACAKMDVANKRVDQALCNLYHTQVLKKFGQDEQNEGCLLNS